MGEIKADTVVTMHVVIRPSTAPKKAAGRWNEDKAIPRALLTHFPPQHLCSNIYHSWLNKGRGGVIKGMQLHNLLMSCLSLMNWGLCVCMHGLQADCKHACHVARPAALGFATALRMPPPMEIIWPDLLRINPLAGLDSLKNQRMFLLYRYVT